MDVRTGFFALLLTVLGAVAALMVLPLLQYVLAAALLAFVCYPVHARLTGLGVSVGRFDLAVGPRLSAMATTVLAAAVVVVPLLFVSIVLLETVFDFLEEFDENATIEAIREVALDLGVDDETLAEAESALLTELEGMLTGGVELVFQELIGLVNTSIRMGIGLLVLVFLLYYLLLDGRTFVDWVGDVAPIEDEVREELLEEVSVVTWAVMRSHVLVALVQGTLGGIGLYLVGVPNVAFWTVVMVVLSFLPAIGVWLVWGPAVAFLAVGGETASAIALLLYGGAVLGTVDNYLRAIFVDRGSGLHPAVVLVGVIGGIYLLGIMGLFLGPVLLAVLKAGLDVFGQVYGIDPGRLDPEPGRGASPRSPEAVAAREPDLDSAD